MLLVCAGCDYTAPFRLDTNPEEFRTYPLDIKEPNLIYNSSSQDNTGETNQTTAEEKEGEIVE